MHSIGQEFIIMTKISQLQQRAQEKDVDVYRQQRELQVLRVRTYYYKFVFVTLVSSIPARVHKPFILVISRKISSWLQCNNCRSVWLRLTDSELMYVGRFWTDVCRLILNWCLQAEMETRIAQIQQQVQEQDAEINRLQRELRVRN